MQERRHLSHASPAPPGGTGKAKQRAFKLGQSILDQYLENTQGRACAETAA